MDHLRIKTIAESDFDSIITEAGGTRICDEASADYMFHEAAVELKCLEEEGLEKTSRQSKIAQLFWEQQARPPVVVIDPTSLDDTLAEKYFNIVSRPIKKHVKKAAGQLKATRHRYCDTSVAALVILNNGYSALSPDEFEAVCLHCTRRYTSEIDWLLVGGIYYYSDTFDFYVIAPFKAIPINIPAPFPSLPKLENAWGEFLNRLMTEHIMSASVPQTEGKLPVVDLDYDLGGIKYVKPAPRMGRSKFWRRGRPRKNSTGLTSCPYVATTLPDFSSEDWARFKSISLNDTFFHDTYENWTYWVRNEERSCTDKLMPIVRVNVDYAAFQDWCKKSSPGWTLSDLLDCANEFFNTKVHDLINAAWDREKLNIIVPEYIHLMVKEIGQDKANDICSISYISEILGKGRREAIIENERIFFEYGVALAAAYAVKRNVGVVLYSRDTTYAWT